ncbi:MAG: pyridoxamine kinase [Clostridia bacterium]|nr:pyridoxamine kinase [Clostridia bacterium]
MKRIVTIQDISCFGKCSITVALPLVSAMGVECAIIPTSVLSTHTGGFKNFTFTDLNEDIPKISKHWKEYNIKFDSIYTGYLGNKKQIDYVIDFISKFRGANTFVFVDPAMADKGKLYAGFNEEFPSHMAKLCSVADMIVPNITEASFLLGIPYTEDYDEAYIFDVCKKLVALGTKKVILTGIHFGNATQGAYFYDGESGKTYYYCRDTLDVSFHGTGDTFSSVLCAGLTRGYSYEKAIKIAVDFTVLCIEKTIPDKENHSYGVKFEECIPELIEMLSDGCNG